MRRVGLKSESGSDNLHRSVTDRLLSVSLEYLKSLRYSKTDMDIRAAAATQADLYNLYTVRVPHMGN